MPRNYKYIIYCYLFLLFVCDTSKSFGHENGKQVIYVASISWHTGLLIPVRAFPDSIWHNNQDYAQYDFIEIGWGDRDFYQHQSFNIWYAAKAVLWPTRTALHINPVKSEYIKWTYADTEIVKLRLKANDMYEVVMYLIGHMAFNEQGKVIPLQKGIYQSSQFIAGSSTYYFPKNSNVWAAIALKRAGLPFMPIFYQTTGMVLNQAEKFGKAIK